jgi:hypothetical protein
MKATDDYGLLQEITDCYIQTPIENKKIIMKILPDISDSKDAQYSDEPVIGRSTPIKNYSYSGIRSISWSAHFVATQESDLTVGNGKSILDNLRLIQSLVYPEESSSAPYSPPPICKLRCGKLLADNEVCAILKSYNVKFDTAVVWSEDSYIPYKIDVDMTWEVVYDSTDLPGQDRIMKSGM